MRAFSLFLAAVLLVSTAQAGLYSEHVTELTSANFDKMVIDTSETWLVKFYAPWCGHCQSSAPAFSKAAKKLHGVAKLGVVNCDDEKNIARRFGIQGFPSIKVFKGEGKKARRPSDYNSERSSKAFIDHVKYVMPSFVARVKPTGTDAFFQDLVKLPHVLLFTEQSTTSPLYKGMSASYKNRISFGEVRRPDAPDLMKKYGITTFPSLIAFESGKSEANNAIHFKGTMNPDSLQNFFSKIASGDTEGANDGEATADGAPGAEEKDPSEKVFSQPKAYSGDVVPLVGTREYEESCGARKDGRMCALAFIPGGVTAGEKIELLKPVAKKYQYDNMAFAVMDGAIEEAVAFASAFGVSADGGFVVVRARKNKFARMEADSLEEASVASFLDKIVGGDAKWNKLEGDLPQWVVEEPETEQPNEETAKENADDEGADEGQCGAPPAGEEGSCGGSAQEDL